jgi:hypothetical protein
LRNPSRVDFVGTHVREPASLAHDAEERPYPKEQFMQKVLIDIFVVPEESRQRDFSTKGKKEKAGTTI